MDIDVESAKTKFEVWLLIKSAHADLVEAHIKAQRRSAGVPQPLRVAMDKTEFAERVMREYLVGLGVLDSEGKLSPEVRVAGVVDPREGQSTTVVGVQSESVWPDITPRPVGWPTSHQH